MINESYFIYDFIHKVYELSQYIYDIDKVSFDNDIILKKFIKKLYTNEYNLNNIVKELIQSHKLYYEEEFNTLDRIYNYIIKECVLNDVRKGYLTKNTFFNSIINSLIDMYDINNSFDFKITNKYWSTRYEDIAFGFSPIMFLEVKERIEEYPIYETVICKPHKNLNVYDLSYKAWKSIFEGECFYLNENSLPLTAFSFIDLKRYIIQLSKFYKFKEVYELVEDDIYNKYKMKFKEISYESMLELCRLIINNDDKVEELALKIFDNNNSSKDFITFYNAIRFISTYKFI